jgi:hypothetical protein
MIDSIDTDYDYDFVPENDYDNFNEFDYAKVPERKVRKVRMPKASILSASSSAPISFTILTKNFIPKVCKEIPYTPYVPTTLETIRKLMKGKECKGDDGDDGDEMQIEKGFTTLDLIRSNMKIDSGRRMHIDREIPLVRNIDDYVLYYQLSRNDREIKLRKALSDMGLSYRYDSKLCGKYIIGTLGKDWTLDKVVNRMCEVKYLYEYTPMKSYYAMNKNIITLEEAEELCMLQVTGCTKYPPGLWPWLRV